MVLRMADVDLWQTLVPAFYLMAAGFAMMGAILGYSRLIEEKEVHLLFYRRVQRTPGYMWMESKYLYVNGQVRNSRFYVWVQGKVLRVQCRGRRLGAWVKQRYRRMRRKNAS
jgi:hypothetical protein